MMNDNVAMNSAGSPVEGSPNDAAISASQPGNLLSRLYQRYGAWTRKIGGAVLDQAFFAGANFIINVLLARWLPIEEYGTFVVIYAGFLLAQNIYEAALIEPMNVFGAGKYSEVFRKYVGFLYYGHAVMSFVLALLIVAAGAWIYQADGEMAGNGVIAVGLMAPFILSRWLSRQPFYVMSKPHLSAFGGLMYFVITVAIIGLMQLGGMLTIAGALFAMGLGGLIATIVLTLFYIKPDFSLKPVQDAISGRSVLRDHWRYGRWSAPARVLRWIPTQLNYLLFPLLVSVSISAALRATMNLVLPITMAISATMLIILPSFVRVYYAKGKEGLTERAKKVAVMYLLITGTYCLVLVVGGTFIIDILYDGRFNEYVSLPYLLTMGLIPIATGVNAVLDAALRAMEAVKQTFMAKIIPTILTVTVGVAMLAAFGLIGATLGMVLTESVMFILLFVIYRRYEDKPPKTDTPDHEALEAAGAEEAGL